MLMTQFLLLKTELLPVLVHHTNQKDPYIDDRKYVHNCSYYMLGDLDSNCFDGIRENEKFKALYAMCKESAK